MSALDAEIEKAMDQAADRAVGLMVDARARRFLVQRSLLDQKLEEGLSALDPKALMERVEILLRRERRQPRLLGFGGENFEISLHAAWRLGEWLLAEQAREVA